MNALGVLVLGFLLLILLLAPRRVALLAMLAGVLYLTQAQSVNVLGFNMYALRFLELAGFVRVMARREFTFNRLNRIDGALLFFYGYTTIVFLLRSSENQAYQIGRAVDACFSYFTFRGLLGGGEEFRKFLRDFVILLFPFVLFLLVETVTERNPILSMAGVSQGHLSRGGRVRCLGTFQFAALLGSLGATFLPLYMALAFAKAGRLVAALGIGLCLLIVWASNSGGPINCAAVALVAWILWTQRQNMKRVRRGIVAVIVLLALFMKAPIWYIPMKLSAFTGGTGWHRSYLMEKAYQEIANWGLAGMAIENTADWLPYGLETTGNADITNEYISFGLAAGVPAIALFVFVLTCAFRALGNALAAARAGPGASLETELLLWGLGAMLVAHVVNWFGCSYYDQFKVVFFLQLAAISTLAGSAPQAILLADRPMASSGRGRRETDDVSLEGAA
jgi:hypothetical protein